MNRLRYTRHYLAGNIDGLVCAGFAWRQDMTNFLQGLGAIAVNPLSKPQNLVRETCNEDVAFRELKKKLKQEENYEGLKQLMKPIACDDLAYVDRVDSLIVGIDLDSRPCGTWWEIVKANDTRKPIIICCKQGKKEMPDWTFALLKHELFFDSWDQVKEYLNYINSSEIIDDLNGRWKIFDFKN